MGTGKVAVVLATILVVWSGQSIGQIEELTTALEVVRLIKVLGQEVIDAWGVLAKEGAELPALPGDSGKREDRILARVEQLGRRIDEAAERGEAASSAVVAAQRALPSLLRYQARLDGLTEAANNVDTLYKTMTRYTAQAVRHSIERHTLEDLAHSVVSHGHGSVRRLLDQLHAGMLGRKASRGLDAGVLALMGNAITEQDANNNACMLKQSPQQLVYNLYSLVALAELKGYAMMQFSWMILRQYDKGNFTSEAQLLKEETEHRSVEKAAAARDAMLGLSRVAWSCDPTIHKENSTWLQLTELLQGHIQNEVDLNPYSTCRETCGYYSYAKVHGCYHNQYCAKQRPCNGRIFNCQYIDSDMWVCPSNGADRRYDWIEYENGRVLGRRDSCSRGSTKVDSWWRWLFWHCSYCFCVCDEPGPKSDRYFSLRQSLADIPSGYVVTGLRFVKLRRVIHIQIQEGKLLPRGGIDESSIKWKPVDSFDITNAAPGIDYHTMNYEQRAMDLDDLTAPEGYVLTGMRFRRIGTHLNPEILATPIDLTTGEVRRDGSLWLSNDNTDAALSDPRTEVKLRSPDVPTRSNQANIPDSNSDQFIQFTHTDISKDAAQTTVPFLDAQPVAPSPPTLLSGAGLYHKGRLGYGGFIGLRVITYDFSKHLGVPLNDTTIFETPENEAPNIV